MEHWWNDTDMEEQKHSEIETCPSATMSSTNPTWPSLGSNAGLRGDRPTARCLRHGTPYFPVVCHNHVVTEYNILTAVFQDVPPYSSVNLHQCFIGISMLQFQGRKIL